jgi:hypothetical protein
MFSRSQIERLRKEGRFKSGVTRCVVPGASIEVIRTERNGPVVGSDGAIEGVGERCRPKR